MARAFRTLVLLAAVALAAGCSVKETPAPSLTGPSELSLSLTVAATPDTIAQDGSSQSLVVVVARDVGGRAVANLPVRFDVMTGGQIVDYGVLSTKTGLTGRRRPRPGRLHGPDTAAEFGRSPDVDGELCWPLPSAPTTRASCRAPWRSGSFRLARFCRLAPVRRRSSPTRGPVRKGPVFPVAFDASSSSSPAGLVSYVWDFGDGTAGSGVAVQHTFAVAGTYVVRLTVTDKKGQTAWSTQRVTVASGPTALFTWTPATPTHGLPVTFDGSLSWAMPPSAIVSYAWDFGDGWSGAGVTAFHAYAAAGTYTVKLVVTDGGGLVGSLTQTVTVQ